VPGGGRKEPGELGFCSLPPSRTRFARSSGDTIPNCWGEFREIRKRKEKRGIAADGRPAGMPGATGVERPSHERTVNGCAAASGEKKFRLILRFGGLFQNA